LIYQNHENMDDLMHILQIFFL